MRIAHLSDIHILSTSGHGVRDFLNKRLTGGANILFNRRSNYKNEVVADLMRDLNAQGDIDHVCVTGDLTSLGLGAEFQIARELLTSLKLGPDHVSIVPGNHDYYTDANQKGHDFIRAFAPFMSSDLPLGEHAFPYVRVRGQVAFIGLSTGIATGWLLAYGRLGQEQLDALDRALGHESLAGKARVVLLHHPPIARKVLHRMRALKDAGPLGEILKRRGAELILHGHEHHDLAYHVPGPGELLIPVRGVPSGSYVGKNVGRHARYHVYEIGAGEGALPTMDGRPGYVGRQVRLYHPANSSFSDAVAEPMGAADLRT